MFDCCSSDDNESLRVGDLTGASVEGTFQGLDGCVCRTMQYLAQVGPLEPRTGLAQPLANS